MLVGEIGCGPGYLLRLLEEKSTYWRMIGFDYDYRLLACAGKRAKQSDLLQGNAENLPFPDGSFSALISLHVIEHLYNPEWFIEEASRILVTNGILILATPNPKGIGAQIMGSQWIGWREDHVSLKTPEEWMNLIENCGFVSRRVGTTGLSGIPLFTKFPLAVLNYLPLLLFGIFPWSKGESFVGLFQRTNF